MIGKLAAGKVLGLRLHLDVAPGEVASDEIVDRGVSHHPAVRAQFVLAEPGGVQRRIVGRFVIGRRVVQRLGAGSS